MNEAAATLRTGTTVRVAPAAPKITLPPKGHLPRKMRDEHGQVVYRITRMPKRPSPSTSQCRCGAAFAGTSSRGAIAARRAHERVSGHAKV
jgi:hypothetical protein